MKKITLLLLLLILPAPLAAQNPQSSQLQEMKKLESYDAKAKLYRIKSFLADGRSTDAEAEFVAEGFQWRFQAPQGLSIRYTIKITDKGEWFERGEMSQDGKSWRQFHEMTLQPVK